MLLSANPLRRVLRRELLALYLVVCIADIVVGLVLPMIPLLARQLGASLTLIGALTAINGGAQVISGIPLGVLSDRRGRGLVIAAGLALFATTTVVLIAAPSAAWLVLAQAALGVGTVATFAIGGALAGSLSGPSDRGAVMGLYSTAMGLGFAIGPLLGGLAGEQGGIGGSLRIAGVVALGGLTIAVLGLPRSRPSATAAATGPTRPPGRNRALLFACVANGLFSPIFSAIVITLLPLQASALGFGSLAIGGMFATRALVSTTTRLPTGMISTPRWSRHLMLLALALGGVALIGLAMLRSYPAVVAALALEGISYGVFLTAGQAFVAQHVEPENLGAAFGSYTMAGGISAALSPFLLGAAADLLGIDIVFWYVGLLVLLGAVALAILLQYVRR